MGGNGRIIDGVRRIAEQGHQQLGQRSDGAALLIGCQLDEGGRAQDNGSTARHG
jgi:hypothetical protein